jgi:hypothetical protein
VTEARQIVNIKRRAASDESPSPDVVDSAGVSVDVMTRPASPSPDSVLRHYGVDATATRPPAFSLSYSGSPLRVGMVHRDA